MMEKTSRPASWPLIAVLVAVAAALGFGASSWLSARNRPAAAPVAQAPAKQDAKSADAPAVAIPAEYIKAANIAVEQVSSGGLQAEILAPASVAAQPNSEAVVVSRAAGNIARVRRQLGDSVRAGEILAEVESLDAATMAADRSATQARLAQARKVAQREASLFEQGVTPRQDLEAAQTQLGVAQAEANRAASIARAAGVTPDGKALAVTSPIAGKVSAQQVTLGAYVQPQTELFRVAGNGQVHVEASVAAADIARIAAGDKATIVTAAGTPLAATVRAVTPTVSGNTRSATVVVVPTAQSAQLVVGEGVQVRLHVKDGAAGLAVPEDAVQNIDGRDVLFVRTPAGFRVQPVRIGLRSGGMAQIVAGVEAGTQVATQNAFLIKAEMQKASGDE